MFRSFDSKDEHPVVVARFDDYWRVGLLLDRLENGLVAVFIPDAPNPHSGAVMLVTPDRIIRSASRCSPP